MDVHADICRHRTLLFDNQSPYEQLYLNKNSPKSHIEIEVYLVTL